MAALLLQLPPLSSWPCWYTSLGSVAQSLLCRLYGIDPSSGLGDGLVSFQIPSSYDAPPQPLHEDARYLPSMLTWTLCSCVWVPHW